MVPAARSREFADKTSSMSHERVFADGLYAPTSP
jgi:hypothetical protein